MVISTNLVLYIAFAIVVLGTTTTRSISTAHAIVQAKPTESNLIDGTEKTFHGATRELSDHAFDEERKGGGGGRGGQKTSTRGTKRGYYLYGAGNPNMGLWNTNGVTRNKECNEFTNWWKRLFNKNIKECSEEDSRQLRG
ncbi:hypothetical protein L914_20212 [Phytophthora nicotianae]|uniref:Uncharacterized protein n=1 Tax=Phytophthora nicotianae TaxID=4792 RepID=W2MA26_PHYNI|nr:hypothetical protein L914_20212 [Phytophthora nicotianae]